MAIDELRQRVLEQGLTALYRSEEERQHLPNADFQFLAATATASTLACVSLRAIEALARHHPDLARQIADELLDLQDDPEEIADYLRSQADTAGIRSGTPAPI